jgi:hypothetical protein
MKRKRQELSNKARIKLGLLSTYSNLTRSIKVIAIEALIKQSPETINTFFQAWLTEKKLKSTPIDIPISTTRQPQVPNFLQLAAEHDQKDVVATLIEDERTRHLLQILDDRQQNLLHRAARFNAIKTLKYLVTNKHFQLTSLINQPDGVLNQASAIHVAAYHGSLEVFNYLKKDVNLSATTANDENIAHLAAGQSNTNILKQLLQDDQHDILHYVNENVEAPVHAAINNNRPPALQFFIFNDHSKRYTSKTDLGRNIAFYATSHNIENRFKVISHLYRNSDTRSLFRQKDSKDKAPFENLLKAMGYSLNCNTEKEKKNKALLLKIVTNYYQTTVQQHGYFSDRLFRLSDTHPNTSANATQSTTTYKGPVLL